MIHIEAWYCPCVPIPLGFLRGCGHQNTVHIHRVDDETPEWQAEYLAGFLEGIDQARHTPCGPCQAEGPDAGVPA